MAVPDNVADTDAFAERLRLQLQARHPGCRVERDDARFGLRVSGPGVDQRLSLVALHHACLRNPERVGPLIGDFVAESERGLTPRRGVPLRLSQLLWCVRTTRYLAEYSRDAELLVRPVAGSLVAFVAEQLPNATMRGVPREEWIDAGEERTAAAADANTASRFARVAERVRSAERVPRDGWQLSADTLFQGSVLFVGDVLAAFAQRTGGDVLLATPDRAIVLAAPAGSAEDLEAFRRRVRRTHRETLNPCSAEVLRSDGSALCPTASGARRESGGLLRRLLG